MRLCIKHITIMPHLTTHSTGARASLSLVVNLAVMQLNARPVNSGVMRPRILTTINEKTKTKP
jgi:hypothetical protein